MALRFRVKRPLDHGSRRCSRPRFDSPQRFAKCGFGQLSVMSGLRAKPIAVRKPEESAESQVSISSDGAFAGDNLSDALRGDADLLGEAVLR